MCSGGNEEGGGNKTETTGKIYHEQVRRLLFLSLNSFFSVMLLLYYIVLYRIVFQSCLALIVFLLMFRLKKGKELEKEEAIKEVKKNIHLIKAPHAGKALLGILVYIYYL